MIEINTNMNISAVTFAVRDMSRSIKFYKKIGFEIVNGNEQSSFTTVGAGEAIVNLVSTARFQGSWWGRVIFRVDNVGAQFQKLTSEGLTPDMPTDAEWGERFFHITDPDGHELSFAQLISQKR